ncbi:MAG: glycosyltransferase [bacterium]
MPLKILQLRSALGVFGAETVILELSKELDALGYDNTVGVLNNTRVPHTELARAAEANHLRAQVFHCRGQFDLSTVRRIRQYLQQEGVQILHTHGYKANFYAWLSGRASNTVRIATCHPWTETDYSRKARLYTRLDKFCLKHFDRIVAVSSTVEKETLESGVAPAKISVIDNGIDTSRFNGKHGKDAIRRKLRLPVNKVIIGTIGRLVPEKGHDLLLRAARGLVANDPNLLFVIVGDGPLGRNLERQRAALGLENQVLLLGQREDVPELLSAFDVFVLSSVSEGLPMVLLEAMAAHKAVIATRVGSIPEVLQEGKTGLLVEPDANDLQHKLAELLQDKSRIAELGKLARERILKDYSSRAMAEKYVRVYGEAVKAKS